jgi:competence transcription factor ComK
MAANFLKVELSALSNSETMRLAISFPSLNVQRNLAD